MYGDAGIVDVFVHLIDDHSMNSIRFTHIVGEEEENLHKLPVIERHCDEVEEIVHTFNHSAPGCKADFPVEHILMFITLRGIYKVNFFQKFAVNAVCPAQKVGAADVALLENGEVALVKFCGELQTVLAAPKGSADFRNPGFELNVKVVDTGHIDELSCFVVIGTGNIGSVVVEHFFEEVKVLKLAVVFGNGVGVVYCADFVAEILSGAGIHLFLIFCVEAVVVEFIVKSVSTGKSCFAVCTA